MSDLSNRYQTIDSSQPLVMSTTGGTFGGPDDSQDNGKFAFGGGSTLPDGTLNPEPYAAVPKQLYDQGIVKPGQKIKVTNPDNGQSAYVIARDIGPSAKNRGIDVSPTVMSALGASTDKPLTVDFSNHEGQNLNQVPDISLGSAPATAPVVAANDSLQGIPSLTPIGSGAPAIPNITAPQGDYTPNQQILADANRAQKPVIDPRAGLSPVPPPIESQTANSVTFKNGVTVYSDGSHQIEHNGDNYMWSPGAKEPHISPSEAKEPHPVMVGGLPYTMNNGKLVPVPVQGMSDTTATAVAPFEGLSDGEKAQAKAILDYRSPLTSRQLSSPNPQIQKLLQRIYLADPNFDVAKYDTNKGTLKDYAPQGKDGQNILSLNQAISHLGHLEDISNNIGGGPIQGINSLVQGGEKAIGMNPALRSYGVTSEAVDQELAKLLKGGVATASEAKEWRAQLDPSQSPAYRKQAFQDIIAVTGGRLDALRGNYETQLGKPLPNGGVLPETQKVLSRHGWSFGTGDSTPASGTPAANATPTPTPQLVAGVPVSEHQAQYARAIVVSKDPNATPENKAGAQKVIEANQKLGLVPAQ